MEQFDNLIKEMAKKEEIIVPNGFDGRVQTVLNDLPPKQKKHKLGAVKAALIAVVACLLLMGTALAASPALREMFWGDFAPYAQDFEENDDAVAVYDGIEIRIVSALADSRAARIVFEVRDLTGDRLTGLYEAQAPNTNVMNGLDWDVYAATKRSEYDGYWSLISYDPETGVARFQNMIMLTQAGEEFDYQTQIEAGAFDTGGPLFYERILSYLTPNGPYGYLGETEYPNPEEIEYGWTLSAHVETLSMREIAVDNEVLVSSVDGDVIYHIEQVEVSQFSVVIECRAEKLGEDNGAYTLWRTAVLELAGGRTIDLIKNAAEWANGENPFWLNAYASFGATAKNGMWYEGYTFSEPIEPGQVTGLWLEGVYIPLK